MGLKIKGLKGLGYKLENIAKRSSEGARDAMRRGANDIKDLAMLQTPVDKYNLEDAIKARQMADGLNRRLTFEVYVDGDVKAGDSDGDNQGKTVGDYAFEMHEGTYELGVLSKDKQRQVRVKVGPKYLERAYVKLAPEIRSDVKESINKRIGK